MNVGHIGETVTQAATWGVFRTHQLHRKYIGDLYKSTESKGGYICEDDSNAHDTSKLYVNKTMEILKTH